MAAHTDQSIDTLVSISGTMASIGLALAGILASKASLDHTETIADDLFLFSSMGFVVVLAIGYLAQKNSSGSRFHKLLTAAEWVFSISLFTIVLGGFVIVYAEL